MKPERLTATWVLIVEMLFGCRTQGNVWSQGLPVGLAQLGLSQVRFCFSKVKNVLISYSLLRVRPSEGEDFLGTCS